MASPRLADPLAGDGSSTLRKRRAEELQDHDAAKSPAPEEERGGAGGSGGGARGASEAATGRQRPKRACTARMVEEKYLTELRKLVTPREPVPGAVIEEGQLYFEAFPPYTDDLSSEWRAKFTAASRLLVTEFEEKEDVKNYVFRRGNASDRRYQESLVACLFCGHGNGDRMLGAAVVRLIGGTQKADKHLQISFQVTDSRVTRRGLGRLLAMRILQAAVAAAQYKYFTVVIMDDHVEQYWRKLGFTPASDPAAKSVVEASPCGNPIWVTEVHGAEQARSMLERAVEKVLFTEPRDSNGGGGGDRNPGVAAATAAGPAGGRVRGPGPSAAVVDHPGQAEAAASAAGGGGASAAGDPPAAGTGAAGAAHRTRPKDGNGRRAPADAQAAHTAGPTDASKGRGHRLGSGDGVAGASDQPASGVAGRRGGGGEAGGSGRAGASQPLGGPRCAAAAAATRPGAPSQSEAADVDGWEKIGEVPIGDVNPTFIKAKVKNIKTFLPKLYGAKSCTSDRLDSRDSLDVFVVPGTPDFTVHKSGKEWRLTYNGEDLKSRKGQHLVISIWKPTDGPEPVRFWLQFREATGKEGTDPGVAPGGSPEAAAGEEAVRPEAAAAGEEAVRPEATAAEKAVRPEATAAEKAVRPQAAAAVEVAVRPEAAAAAEEAFRPEAAVVAAEVDAAAAHRCPAVGPLRQRDGGGSGSSGCCSGDNGARPVYGIQGEPRDAVAAVPPSGTRHQRNAPVVSGVRFVLDADIGEVSSTVIDRGTKNIARHVKVFGDDVGASKEGPPVLSGTPHFIVKLYSGEWRISGLRALNPVLHQRLIISIWEAADGAKFYSVHVRDPEPAQGDSSPAAGAGLVPGPGVDLSGAAAATAAEKSSAASLATAAAADASFAGAALEGGGAAAQPCAAAPRPVQRLPAKRKPDAPPQGEQKQDRRFKPTAPTTASAAPATAVQVPETAASAALAGATAAPVAAAGPAVTAAGEAAFTGTPTDVTMVAAAPSTVTAPQDEQVDAAHRCPGPLRQPANTTAAGLTNVKDALYGRPRKPDHMWNHIWNERRRQENKTSNGHKPTAQTTASSKAATAAQAPEAGAAVAGAMAAPVAAAGPAVTGTADAIAAADPTARRPAQGQERAAAAGNSAARGNRPDSPNGAGQEQQGQQHQSQLSASEEALFAQMLALLAASGQPKQLLHKLLDACEDAAGDPRGPSDV